MINEEDVKLLNDIEEKVIKDIDLGYDPRVLETLDDENASSDRIESFQSRITADIVAGCSACRMPFISANCSAAR